MPLPRHDLDLDALLRDLTQGPVALADGLTLLSHDVALGALGALGALEAPGALPQGSIRASIFGREIELCAARSAEGSGADVGVTFEGSLADPLVDLGPLGALSLTRVALRSAPRAATPSGGEGAPRFTIEGAGRLEIRGLAGLDPLALEGALTAETGGASDGRYLRLHFQDARAEVRAPGGAALGLSFKRLYFLWAGSGEVEIEMTADIAISGLPEAIQCALPREILADVTITQRGLRARAASVFEGITVPLPAIPRFGGAAPVDLGELRLSASNLIVTLGSELACAVDITVSAPPALRSIAEPSFALRLTASAADVEVRLLSSPLKAITMTPSATGAKGAKSATTATTASIDLGAYGQASLSVPVFRVDWAERCLAAEGLFRYRELRLPLAPLAAHMRARGMGSVADQLPDSLALRPTGLAGAASMIADIIESALGRGALGERAREELTALAARADRLPARLRGSFLSVGAPPELGFRFRITAELDAKIDVFVPPPGAEPLKALVPLVGPSGPDLIGVSLYKFAVSQLLGGQLFTAEIDADIDRFPLLPIALAATLSASGLFPPPEQLEQRLTLRGLFLAAVPTAGAPALIPLFFDQIGVLYQGIDGAALEARFGLPSPIRDFASVAGLLRRMGALLADPTASRVADALPPEIRLALTVGPAYVKLPPFLGGGALGSTSPGPPIEAPLRVARARGAAEALDFNALLSVIPDDFGERDVEIELGASYRRALRLWTTAIAPALGLASRAARSAPREPAQAPKPKTEGLSGRLSALRGHVAQGISALSGDAGKEIVRARVVSVSSEGIRLRTSLPRSEKGSPSSAEIELRWDNLLGSAARLAGEHDVG